MDSKKKQGRPNKEKSSKPQASKKPHSGAPRPKLLLSPKDGKIVAITGGIATGKSFVLQCFEQLGFKVFNADREIHKMLMRGGAAFDEVSKLFPDAVTEEGIDRKIVGAEVFKSKEKLVELEKVLHPKIQQAQLDMVIENKKGFQQTLVFEIPLLFENNRHKNFDYVITVTAPKEVQKERVLARNNMTEEKFNAIIERQVSDSIRLKGSHFVIRTGKSKEDTIRQIKSIIRVRTVREIVLDTETTGLYAKSGDKIIEVGCVELIDKVRTGSTYHAFINPQRDIPMESFKIHGISDDMVKDKPIFSKLAPSFLEYIGNSRLIIHNAGFDVSFLNYELIVSGHPEISMNRVTDTLTLARKKFPGAPASLDALCKRFDISLASRTNHGALIDAELLAIVYIELMGGPQSSFNFNNAVQAVERAAVERMKREPRESNVSNDDAQKHSEFLAKAVKNSAWN